MIRPVARGGSGGSSDQVQAYLVLSVLMLLEGPATTVAAGSMVGAGVLALLPVWLLAVSADVVGDSLLYALGRSGRHRRMLPLLARLGVSGARAARLLEDVRRRLPRVVVGAKLVDIGAVPAFLAAGLAGVPYRRFVGWVALTSSARAAVLVALGLLAGPHIAGIASSPWAFVSLSAALGGCVLAVSLIAKKFIAKKSSSLRTRGVLP
ncbi:MULTISPECIES: DedA family protein [unclassified Modestobacter]|uniref:DedA family protein n=1 Tax=unclassified Modestobacter TaxID=2643866 RepID=UPI0022AAA902|nr:MULTISPECIES: VTT domain-containing protein [unclassified Modestobacter]MCZ2824515.1 VTT domain-containing protein [Modestobacter sp. VKM Ac-2981]MCZ2853957.1 VTT domain-containing protein [Modestobacter sp. VKM Ac-2982]